MSIELFKLEGFLLVLLTLFDKLVEHIFEISLSASDFLDHLSFFLLKRLNFIIEHVSKVLKCGLLISGIFASLLFGLNNLKSL